MTWQHWITSLGKGITVPGVHRQVNKLDITVAAVENSVAAAMADSTAAAMVDRIAVENSSTAVEAVV